MLSFEILYLFSHLTYSIFRTVSVHKSLSFTSHFILTSSLNHFLSFLDYLVQFFGSVSGPGLYSVCVLHPAFSSILRPI